MQSPATLDGLGLPFNSQENVIVHDLLSAQEAYADGTVIEYNKTSHTLSIDTSAASGMVLIKCNAATIEAVSSVTIDAPNTTCTGNLSVAKSLTMGAGGGTATITGNVAISGGTLTHNGKNIGDNHQHTGVQTGGGNTGGVL